MTSFHRNALPMPSWPSDRRLLVQWLLEHPLWQHEYLVEVRPDDYQGDNSVNDILNWPKQDIKDGTFYDCVDIAVVYVNRETLCIDDDETKNTMFRVWLEGGGWYDLTKEPGKHWPQPEGGWNQSNKWIPCHDYNLDCGGRDLEEAMVKLALLIKYHYGDTDQYLEGVIHEPCKGTFDANEVYHSACVKADDGFCKECGFRMGDMSHYE